MINFRVSQVFHTFQLQVDFNVVSCKIQLNDCVRNTTAVCNPRQNSLRDKIQSKTKSSPRQNPKNFLSEKKFC